jgi:DNA modification methylase
VGRPIDTIIQGDALNVLKTLDADSIDCCVTSPPYWALRDYKTEGQLGLEPMFNEYLDHLIEIFAEVKRVIKPTGAIWVNIGDTYGRGDGTTNKKQTIETNNDRHLSINPKTGYSKSLIGIPERFAIRMTDELGLIRRNSIIWFKGNAMPSSAKDRFTVDFEYLYFFTKSPRYYFETQYEPALNPEDDVRRALKTREYNKKASYFGGSYHNNKQTEEEIRRQVALGRIKRCVWRISTKPFSGAHFAVFPPGLIETPIKATCPVGGTVLDPFAGAGTTAITARALNRHFIGIELNPDYVQMANARLGVPITTWV